MLTSPPFFLQYLNKQVLTYYRESRAYLLDNPNWNSLATLFGLVACSVPPILKAHMLRTIAAFARDRELRPSIWQSLEASRILATTTAGELQGSSRVRPSVCGSGCECLFPTACRCVWLLSCELRHRFIVLVLLQGLVVVRLVWRRRFDLDPPFLFPRFFFFSHCRTRRRLRWRRPAGLGWCATRRCWSPQ